MLNQAWPLVAKYNSVARMKELGYNFPIRELDCLEAECFLLIQREYELFEEAKRKPNGVKN